MPRGSTGQRVRTRTRLLEAALNAFAERGFYGASIEYICEQAGFTRGAFYSNFPSKDELFFALFDAHGDQIIARLRAALEESRKSNDPVARFVALIDKKDDEERRWYLISTEFTLYAIRETAAAAPLAEHDARIRREAVDVINELMAISGRELLIDAEIIARMASAVQEGAAAQAYVEPDHIDAQLMERLLLPAILRTYSRPRTHD
ncbi:TetR/AcrR family transcriptional regulator [Mycolicibacterium llatzerense]|uniref:TetR/AcrR family transcriptional regulator n=1 Tax=Mycolicibacterium llatzerense TaxID=280871 RepID=UPI0008DDAE78|nr:TetR/AcrR family transcriptional regulator [Mycolicibacterium llatzerense]